MIDIETKIYHKVKSYISTWDEEGIYAISFLVDSNENYEYKDYDNISSFAISYNTESDCDGAGEYEEDRWNYAFWRQDETFIIDPVIVHGLEYAWYDLEATKKANPHGEANVFLKAMDELGLI